MIRSFRAVFPHVYIASTILEADILLLGSFEPLAFDQARMERGFAVEPVRADMADERVGVEEPAALLGRVLMGPAEVDALMGDGPLHTDDLPVIAYTTPRDLYLATRRPNVEFLLEHATGLAPHLRGATEPWVRRIAEAHRRLFSPGDEPDDNQ